MASSIYTFTFAASYQGGSVAVTSTALAKVVAHGAADVRTNAGVVFTASLPDGSYTATATHPFTGATSTVDGVEVPTDEDGIREGDVGRIVAAQLTDESSPARASLNSAFAGIANADGTPLTGTKVTVLLDPFGDIDDIVSEAI